MTVKELMALLSIYDKDQKVMLGCEHDGYTAHAIRTHKWSGTPGKGDGALVLLPSIEFFNLSEEDWS
jgi:hypothetical protein